MQNSIIRNPYARLIYTTVLAGLALSGLLEGNPREMFKYYTFLSNALVAGVYLAQTVCCAAGLLGKNWHLPAGIKGWTVLAIAFTFLTVFLVLNPFCPPTDWLDARIHYLVPLLTVAEWLLFEPHGTMKWYHPLLWLLTPLAYYGYVMVLFHNRVFFNGNRFPYFFMNYARYGWDFVLGILCALAGVFLVFGLLMLLFDHWVYSRCAGQK
jgi:hypothetical protein